MAEREATKSTDRARPSPSPKCPRISTGRDPSPRAIEPTGVSSLNSSHFSRREYLDSLVPPSPEEFSRIAKVQASRENEQKSRSRELRRRSAETSRGAKSSRPGTSASSGSDTRGRRSLHSSGSHTNRPAIVEDILLTRAATLIQRTYRGYRVRRQMAGLGIDAGTRWTHALREARFRDVTEPRPRTDSLASPGASPSADGSVGSRDGDSRSAAARRNWKKAVTVARRAAGDSDSDSAAGPLTDSESLSTSSSSRSSAARARHAAAKKRKAESRAKRKKEAKTMGLQYFLEMVDSKHRYGSNLRVYHEEWKKSDTHENFFYWLDQGEGRLLDIEACPRERLEREQVRYLSREERQYYLVKVDDEGRLCWAKNGARIDTTEEWKDSIHGIVPRDDQTPAFEPKTGHNTRLLGDSSTGESEASGAEGDSDPDVEAARAAKYATPGLDGAKGLQKVRHVSAATIFNKLLRKSVKKNTWIFVADTSFRLYVGIKDSGAFQHSSFLQGGRISAAGLIKIKNGRLKSLSPLSGHYKPPAANFRAFVKSLRDAGVDMKHVSISKSYAVLVGLEAYMRTRKKGKEIMQKMMHGKDKIVAPEEVAKREEEQRDKTESAARERAVLEREAEARAGNRSLPQLIEKLHLRRRAASGHAEAGEREGEEEQAMSSAPV